MLVAIDPPVNARRVVIPADNTHRAFAGRVTRWLKYSGGAVAASFVVYTIAYATGLVEGKRPQLDPDLAKLQAIHKGEYKPPNKTFKGGDQGWLDLKLHSVQTINHNTSIFRFKLPDENDVSGLQTASALLTKYKGPEMEKVVIRPYTPVSAEDQRGYIDFIIKKYPNGPMSEHFHSMDPPQRMDFKGPIPKYQWEQNKHDHICLIAGGTGITPMYQLCRAIFSNPNDKTKVTLVFGNVTEEDILLKRELEHLENTFPRRFKAFYMLDKPPKGWTQGTGYISRDLLKQVLPEPKVENVKLFVCGPPGMYKAISGMKKSPSEQGELSGLLKELGYTEEQVYKF
ncbi:MAG: hypothetical protein Q9181_007147 [Wetmoreana brouardii]